MKNNKFSKEIEQYMIENYIGKDNIELAKEINEKFNTSFTNQQITSKKKYMKKAYGIALNSKVNNSTFKKGHIPYCKGKKWVDYLDAETIKRIKSNPILQKGHIPSNIRPDGDERQISKGYRLVTQVKYKGKWEYKNRVIWQKHYGEIPKDYNVMFADGDNTNFDINNLVLVKDEELIYMNTHKLITNDIELTKTGLNLTKLNLKINRIKKENK